ncbi:molybdate ABC transporter substrate-binding protein [Ruminococcaceae bacterium OttesenSCG-928-A11]|nr:molybdate ABC transporter substrate-binding protein [Ruminococcaceae bacterium OttesenSCG-928-A11]
MKKLLAVLLSVLMMCLMLAACGADSGSTTPASEPATTPEPVAGASEPETEETHEPVTLMLAAAASLKDSFDTTLIPMFQQQYGWITVTGTYDSSGKLQTQIEEGLAADVFMSAAKKQMNALTESSMIDADTVVDLLENEIVLIAPIDSELEIAAFEDIVKAGTIALGDPESVPAGQYAEEALTTLGLWDTVQAKTVSLGTNVTEVLNQVAEGSADVGIVYATDAAQMPGKVKVLAAAPEGSLAAKVIYPVGILAGAPQREAAELFMEFLQSDEAMAVFTANGFKANTAAAAS